jgi:hypothetical protein
MIKKPPVTSIFMHRSQSGLCSYSLSIVLIVQKTSVIRSPGMKSGERIEPMQDLDVLVLERLCRVDALSKAEV